MGENLRNRALQYYISKGLSPQAAAGIVGMLMSESSLSPDSVNASSGAYGLAQWLGPRKRELFRRYGSKPTFDNQLDYTWYEMNNTHKNALKYLNAAQTPEDAAKAAFGYYAFMTGPEGAIKEMEKYGQNGKASLAQKIKYANDVYNWANGNTFVVHPRYEKYQNPNGKVEKTYIADTLPELVVTGNRPKLTLPSISQSQEQAIAKQLLKTSGFNPDMPMWEQYAPTYRPLVIPQHYEGGKEGNKKDVDGVTGAAKPFELTDDEKEALMYAKSYYDSEGFQQRFDNLDGILSQFVNSSKYNYLYPYQKTLRLEKSPLKLNGVVRNNMFYDNAAYLPELGYIEMGNYHPANIQYGNNTGEVFAHEMGHAISNSINMYGDNDSKMQLLAYPDIYPVFRNSKSYKETLEKNFEDRDIFEKYPSTTGPLELHDARPEESYGDLMEFRNALHKFGIYDSRKKDQKFTKKHLEDLKWKQKHKYRLQENFSEDDIIWMMNNVAKNNIRKPKNINFA